MDQPLTSQLKFTMPISLKSLTRHASQAYVMCNYLSGLCQQLGRERYMRSLVRLQHGPGTGFFGVSNTGSTDCVKERFRGITDSLEQSNSCWRGIDFISETCINIDAPDFRNVHRVEHTHEVSDLYCAFEESFIVPRHQFSANDIAIFIVRNQIVCLIQQVEQRSRWSFDHALPFSKYSRKIIFNREDVSECSVAELIAINDIRYANLLDRLRSFDFTALNATNSTKLTGDGHHTMPSLEIAERFGEDEFELLTRHYRHKLWKRITPGSAWYSAVDADRYRKWLARREASGSDDEHASL